MADTGIVCLLVDDTQPTRWRIAVTSRPVIDFSRAESRRLGANLYAAHTPMYGAHTDVARIERYLNNYDLGGGWYGPLSGDVMRGIALRIHQETAAFLDGAPLP